ncbi:hypothetical protein ILUMI_27110 [Ignelater luminosus]|uniref:Uncharacterized protein n=1 Tax=Ignelater luminosus TaxID=2038154 RepID=A0A8K0FX29_IGNLU|nr:hypothetical protein ILUMI_27110 [Ignelater luminosus]
MVSNFAGILTIFLVLFAIAYGDDPADFPIEKGCSKAGGICMPTDECPVEIIADYKGLCPNANKKDPSVQCCHGISLKETRCQRFGGECQPRCPDDLKVPRAKDCTDGKVCCVLV